MKKNTFSQLALFILGVFFLMGCSKGQEGTWNIEKYEINTPGSQGISLTNIGTITFNSDGTGTKNVTYPESFSTRTVDNDSFTWTLNGENYIIIDGDAGEFTKTWILTSNNSDSQSWRATDGGAVVQTLELRRQ